MKKQTFIVGTIILTIGGFIAKVIGAFYKIPLTNILGSAGMGIYYLVFPMYNLMLVFSSSGVGVAVTRLVAEARSKKIKRDETTYLKAGIIISFSISLIFSIIMAVFAKQLAYEQGNILSRLGFVAIAPAIISASLVTVIKGYFQGIENMIPSSLAMIIEQIVKLVMGLILSHQLLPYGVEYAVMGSVLAVTISETVTLIIMLINFFWHKKFNDEKFYSRNHFTNKFNEIKVKCKVSKHNNYKNAHVLKISKVFYFYKEKSYTKLNIAIKKTVKMLIPNTLMSLVMPLVTLIDSFLVINLLTKAGYSSYTATSLYGINNGVVSSLISLPVIITSSLAIAVVPNLSGLVYLNKKQEISERTSFFIKITWIIVLPIFLFFAIKSKEIISALYNFSVNNVINEYGFACKLLLLSSVSIIYSSLLSTFISILQAINKPYQVFFIMLFSVVVRTIISVVLLQSVDYNIFGIVIANLVFLLLSVIGCLILIRKYIVLKINILNSFIAPIFALLLSGGCVLLATLFTNKLNIWINLIVSGVVLLVSYCSCLIFFNCFDKIDEKYVPLLKRLKK